MAPTRTKNRKPAIIIGQLDYEKLTRIAEGLIERRPEIAEELLGELDRASVVADATMREDVVRMGSAARYVTDTGEDRTVTLVYPGEADIEAGKISILTPIGVALLGLSPNQTIHWQARDGRVHRLTVKSVMPCGGSASLPA